MELAILILAAYLIGSIPFGLILTRTAGLGDIRQIGSGNIGATNVLRTGNKKLAALTLFLDGLKGWAAVMLARFCADHILACRSFTDFCGNNSAFLIALLAILASALGVVVGHMFPLWLRFKGGKGVATTLGAAFGLNWMIGAAGCATWLLMAVLFRYSSLSALVAIAALPVYAWYMGPAYHLMALALFLIALLVWLRHHENIRRLLKGTEPKIGQKK